MYLPTKIKKLAVKLYYGLLPPKDKKFRRKKALALLDKEYLRRYLPVLDGLEKNTDAGEKADIIWVCWLQGEENAPEIVKACLRQMRRMQPDMRLIVVTRDNLTQYVHIPEYILKKWCGGVITNTHFSDILRVCLLYEHGGIWLDSTAFLMEPLREEILNAPFFAFHSRLYLHKYPKILDCNNWFLVSQKKHPLIAGIRALLFAYWQKENRAVHYFFYHLLFDLMTQNNSFYAAEWAKVPLLYDDCSELAEKLTEPYNPQIWEEIKSRSPLQKLSYKYQTPETDVLTFEKFILNMNK